MTRKEGECSVELTHEHFLQHMLSYYKKGF